jgi:hypothetical protein
MKVPMKPQWGKVVQKGNDAILVSKGLENECGF